ncbi:1239_t:CDS:2 [Dentiscutata erythropus]|uniref:1239_t:CDS:1 n=1 Tax=Dentiscutata erythropus TaxID=1348616 RepID=A0A9N9HNE0_9GLOM|nr:1239_t:CDS:2 [Dentiscutata erythropus]
MQSTQWVEGTNRLIKTKISTKTTLLNLDKIIQMKLEHEAQYQQLSEYKNAFPTQGLPSIQSVFFEPVQNEIKKYLTLKFTSVQSIQISQSILYHACLFELTLLPAVHEYTDGYFENEYDALQALLENLVNMVNCENILETWKMSRNAKFDVKLIFKHWYTDPMQASDYSMIEGTAIEELDSNEQINQLISIRGPDAYQATKSGLKFALDNGLVDEFAGLIEKFTENHTDVDVNNRMIIEEDKSDKLRQIVETDTEEVEERPKKRNEMGGGNSTRRTDTRHCGNCYGTGHYSSTCQFPKDHFR